MYFSSIWEALSFVRVVYTCMGVTENHENIQKRGKNGRSSLPGRTRRDLTRQVRIRLSFEFEIKLDL